MHSSNRKIGKRVENRPSSKRLAHNFHAVILQRDKFVFESPEWDTLHRKAMLIFHGIGTSIEIKEFQMELKKFTNKRCNSKAFEGTEEEIKTEILRVYDELDYFIFIRPNSETELVLLLQKRTRKRIETASFEEIIRWSIG